MPHGARLSYRVETNSDKGRKGGREAGVNGMRIGKDFRLQSETRVESDNHL